MIHGEKHIEKQMGCMAGFFQLFDRHHILAGKRLYSTTKRLTSPSPVSNSPPEPEKPRQKAATGESPPPTENLPLAAPKTAPLAEVKEGLRSPWKFGKEAPRLSLDSRATVDAKGKLYPRIVPSEIDGGDEKRRSTSVIARLMGLEPLPEAPNVAHKAELRRSASESRVSKDLSRFIDLNRDRSFENTPYLLLPTVSKIENAKMEKNGRVDPGYPSRPWKSPQQRKNYFDSEDFFPEPKQNNSIYNEIERRLRMRGIDEPCKDLETLKQILEAMQLKGLLRNKRHNSGQMNYVFADESPIVLVKPARSRTPPSRAGTRSGARTSVIGKVERESPRRERPRNTTSSPTRRDGAKNSPNSSPLRRRPLGGVETQRRTNEFSDQRRAASPVHSPRLSPRRVGLDQTAASNHRSTRNRRTVFDANEKIRVVVEDESSSITESTVSTSSQTDTERSKMEEYKGGRSLLERCDKLLNSIAEMTAMELQPSPVSVLDSSFYKDESSSPSPIMKRSIHFKDQHEEYEDDIWSPTFSPIQSLNVDTIHDSDYVYISDILRAGNYLHDDSDTFLFLEKQQYHKGNNTSKSSTIQRKLIFDTISEILNRNSQIPPWKLPLRPNFGEEKPSISHIWFEFQRIKERDSAEEDLFDTICSVLRKDLAGDAINGWGDCHMETSEAVLDIERLIFKDLVGETIQDLATLGGINVVSALRRKLVF